MYDSAFGSSSSMGVGSSARCWSSSGDVGAAFASLWPSCVCCSMIGISTSTSKTIFSTGLTASGICWASEHSWSWVPRGGDDATVSGGEFGDVDPSPIPVGWGFDVVVSFAGRWSEGRFPPAFDDRLTGGRDSGFGRISYLCLVSGRTQGLVVNTCEFADLGTKTLETLEKVAEKRYGLVRYMLHVLFQ